LANVRATLGVLTFAADDPFRTGTAEFLGGVCLVIPKASVVAALLFLATTAKVARAAAAFDTAFAARRKRAVLVHADLVAAASWRLPYDRRRVRRGSPDKCRAKYGTHCLTT
jgi:hypothetical protein